MKFLPFLFFIVALNCQAQVVQQKSMKVTEKSVVKDTNGTVYPYNIWTQLMQTGNFSLKPTSLVNPKDEYIIYELTQKEKEDMFVRLPKPKESPYFVTGQPFGEFKTTDINRNKLNLQDMKGKVLVINFWFINCPPCRKEIPELNKLVEKYKDRNDVVFIGIALDDKYDLREFLKTTPFNYTIVDGGSWIASQMGIKGFPTNVVVDQEGIVQFHADGYSMSIPRWIDKTITSLIEKASTPNTPN
jgi:thiol-disulfide isomerase/thioredoxin